jgi:predicted ATPase/Flp pilus assembly protein TadD
LAEARPELPRPIHDAVERAMALDPARRFPNVAELRAALESCSLGPGEPIAGAHLAHLPREIGRFIGREDALLEIRRHVLNHPLVTLTGVGGCGKTRLAIRVATQLHEAFENGSLWVDLAPVETDEAVTLRIAGALGVPEQASIDIETLLVETLRDRRVLLVLDNCEHVRAPAARLLERVLPRCPQLHVLVTSREELGIRRELRFDVPPMALTDPSGSRDVADVPELGGSEAVRLFVDRAQSRRPDFVLTSANTPAVARICRRVDGIPLAIELAAARVTALGTDQIASRLEESFRLLSGGRDDDSPHHRTMQACIDWSFRLLSPEEQSLLCRLSLFAGRWSLEAAEGSCADSFDHASGIALLGSREVDDLLTALVEKSLVQSETGKDEERERTRVSFRMLEMVRRFARERLEPEDATRTQMRMRSYYEAIAEKARSEMGTAREGPWIARFSGEHENFRVVLDGCAGGGAGLEPAMRIITVLRRYWLVARHLREGLAYVERLLLPHAESERDRADATYLAASLASPQSDYDATRRYAGDSLPRMRALGDRKGTAAVLAILGIMAIDQADYETARAHLEEAIAIDRELGNLGPIPNRLNSLGIAASRQSDHKGADVYFSQALEMFRQSGNLIGVSTMLANLSTSARLLEQKERARDLAQEAMEVARRTGHRPCETQAIRALANAHLQFQDLSTARRLLCDALRLERELEDSVQIAWCLEALGHLEQEAGHPQRAIRVTAAAAAIRDRKRVPIPELDRMDRTQRLEALRADLGERAFTDAWASGWAMTAEEAVELALSPPE